MNTTTSDYYFSTGDFVGFKVQILNPSEFPDIQNGGLTQLFVDTNTKAYFKLIPTTIDSKSAIEQYSPIQRGCLFEHELFEQYAGHYSFVDCLLKCKLRNIITICGCIPFFLPTNFPDGTVSPVKCTLAHNKCLERIRRNYFTHGLSLFTWELPAIFFRFPFFQIWWVHITFQTLKNHPMMLLNAWNVYQFVQRPISGCYHRILNWIKKDLLKVNGHYCKYTLGF